MWVWCSKTRSATTVMKNNNIKKLKKIINKFSGKKITVIGDIMLDKYIKGSVDRISPEAPVPVVRVTEEKMVPGGCGNVAWNLAELGAFPSIISIIGEDESAIYLKKIINQKNIDISGIFQIKNFLTIEKTRIIAEHQQIVRFDREKEYKITPHTETLLINTLNQKISQGCHAVIFSDYGKGVFSQKIIETAIKICLKAKIPVCVDPKIEHFRKYKNVTCITPNTSEAFQGMGLFPQKSQKEIENLGVKIIKTLNPKCLLITQGESGMTLFDNSFKKTKIIHIPTRAIEVYDVTGAGDTVISTFALSLAAGGNFEEAAKISNLAAGIVVGKLGTATVSQSELLKNL